MHAGREVRVFVGEQERIIDGAPQNDDETGERLLTDNEIKPLAKDIAHAIESQMEFPGQIRVTVIRETRVVGFAR
jgi:HD superfamily phosphodiesterase